MEELKTIGVCTINTFVGLYGLIMVISAIGVIYLILVGLVKWIVVQKNKYFRFKARRI